MLCDRTLSYSLWPDPEKEPDKVVETVSSSPKLQFIILSSSCYTLPHKLVWSENLMSCINDTLKLITCLFS